ncbi:PSA aminopeptidase, partial [Sylvia borin]|nr:PSA aminopeptidase [Sylvia borin]
GHLDALLRGLVLGKLGKAGHKATLEEARRRFKEHVEGKHVLSADLRSPVGPQSVSSIPLGLGFARWKVGGAFFLQSRWREYRCFFPPQEEVRPQDTVSVIGGVAGGSKQGRKAAWKFVRDNWEELYNRYQGGFLISRLIKV